MIANTEVLKQLATLCHASETGTFFITTTDNKACHILLDSGRITALSYGLHRGQKVIPELPFIKIERFSFQQQVKMPLSSRAYIEQDVDVLSSLGLQHTDKENASGKRMYRGAEIETKRELPTLKKAGDEDVRKKPARMYRGRVLED